MMIQLSEIQKVFFLGIGGIGMSAVARYFMHLGVEVFGYDRTKTELTQQLEEEGMVVHYEDDVDLLPDAVDLVVWTPAIPKSNLQWQFFQSSNMKMMKRAEVLGMISKEKRAIAVAGTHGKTTTSIMLSFLLHETGADISAFLGGISTNYRTNFLAGKSDWVVMEADEYDRSFWQIFADMIIVTSMDADHLDVYGSHDEMIRSYKVFIDQINDGGSLIYHESVSDFFDHEFIDRLKARNVQLISYGNETVVHDHFHCLMPGLHNRQNMIAAMIAAMKVKKNEKRYLEVMKGFKGIERRFEILGEWNGWQVISDYAHHPKELEAAIQAARSFFKNRHLTGVFQPHLYSRTKDFADDFALVLDTIDQPVLVELYPAREEPIEDISSATITRKMKNKNVLLTTKKELTDQLKEKEIDVLLILGAGDLDSEIRAQMSKMNTQRIENN